MVDCVLITIFLFVLYWIFDEFNVIVTIPPYSVNSAFVATN